MLTATLSALLSPRRAVPLALVAVALVAVEAAVSGSVAACAIDLGLWAGFVLAGPASWRWTARAVRREPRRLGAYAVFAGVGLAVIALVASAPLAFGLPGTYAVDPPAVPLLLVLFYVGAWGLGRDIDLELGIESAARLADRLTLEAERARLLALRAQLDPHFLFNTLNAIAEWCREDPALAERAILDLAAVLRSILDGSTRPSWPLARELDLLAQLAALHAARDPDRVRVHADVPHPLPEVEIPPLLFLPLLENAITHGPAAGHRGVIELRLREAGDAVRLVLENPGAFAGRREGGLGLAMVERRLELAYADAARLSVRAEGDRTVVEVLLPRAPVAAEMLAPLAETAP